MGNILAHALQQPAPTPSSSTSNGSSSSSDADSVADPTEFVTEEYAEEIANEYEMQPDDEEDEDGGARLDLKPLRDLANATHDEDQVTFAKATLKCDDELQLFENAAIHSRTAVAAHRAEGPAAPIPTGLPCSAFAALLRCGREPEWVQLLANYLASAKHTMRPHWYQLTKEEVVAVIKPMLRELDVYACACAAFIEEEGNAPGAAYFAHFFASLAAYDRLVGEDNLRAHAALAMFAKYAWSHIGGVALMDKLVALHLRRLPGTSRAVRDLARDALDTGDNSMLEQARALQRDEHRANSAAGGQAGAKAKMDALDALGLYRLSGTSRAVMDLARDALDTGDNSKLEQARALQLKEHRAHSAAGGEASAKAQLDALDAMGLYCIVGTPQKIKDVAASGLPEDIARARELQLEEVRKRQRHKKRRQNIIDAIDVIEQVLSGL
jgi:hypothetical protein